MKFIGVSFGVVDNRLVAIATSERYSLVDLAGISTVNALGFLLSIAKLNPAPKRALVMFDAAVDLELVLQDIPARQKDVLFGLYKKQENRAQGLPIFDDTTPEYKGVMDWRGFRLSMLAGKILRVKLIKGDVPGLTFFDIASYFESDIDGAAVRFLNANPLDRVE